MKEVKTHRVGTGTMSCQLVPPPNGEYDDEDREPREENLRQWEEVGGWEATVGGQVKFR
jgi:hypothetical protein